MTLTTPTKGTRFLHRHWLDVSQAPARTPQLFTVTRVTQSAIYYRPVYDSGLPSERLGSAEYCTPERWEHVCLEVLK